MSETFGTMRKQWPRGPGGAVNANDQLVETLLREVPERLICEMLAQKFAEQGVELTERERKKLARIVHEPGNVKRFRFRRWKWWEKRSVTIEFTPEDIAKLERIAKIGRASCR